MPSNSAKEIKVKIIPAQREYEPSQEGDVYKLQWACSKIAALMFFFFFLLGLSRQRWRPLDSWMLWTLPRCQGSRLRRRNSVRLRQSARLSHLRLTRYWIHSLSVAMFVAICVFFLTFIWHEKTPFKRISRPQVISFDGKPSSGAKPSSPDAGVSSMQVDENNEPEQPGTPVPADDPEASDNSEIHFLELLCYTVLFFFFLFLDLKFKSFVS